MVPQHRAHREPAGKIPHRLRIIRVPGLSRTVPLYRHRTTGSVAAARVRSAYSFLTRAMRNKYNDKVPFTTCAQWGAIATIRTCKRFGQLRGTTCKSHPVDFARPALGSVHRCSVNRRAAKLYSAHRVRDGVAARVNCGFSGFWCRQRLSGKVRIRPCYTPARH